eukprot:6172561-Pleurochrysis_carterae.AAC.2
MSSKAVSTFVGLSISAFVNPSVPFWDQVDLSLVRASSNAQPTAGRSLACPLLLLFSSPTQMGTRAQTHTKALFS